MNIQKTWRVIGLFLLLFFVPTSILNCSALTGVTTPYGYFYLPSYGAKGLTEKSAFDAALIATDAVLHGLVNISPESPWVDYSATSTIVGWSSSFNPTMIIKYKKVGTTVFVYFSFYGFSNSTVATFTLPYSCVWNDIAVGVTTRMIDDGLAQSTPGMIRLVQNQVYIYKTCIPNSAFSAGSNIKHLQGQFFYETTP